MISIYHTMRNTRPGEIRQVVEEVANRCAGTSITAEHLGAGVFKVTVTGDNPDLFFEADKDFRKTARREWFNVVEA